MITISFFDDYDIPPPVITIYFNNDFCSFGGNDLSFLDNDSLIPILFLSHDNDFDENPPLSEKKIVIIRDQNRYSRDRSFGIVIIRGVGDNDFLLLITILRC